MSILKDLATIEAGYPFRGGIKEVAGGDAAVVRVKDVSVEDGVDWPNLPRTRLLGRREPSWLEAGDIVFLARGVRVFAAEIKTAPVRAVCSPHFFLIKVKTQDLLPGFLAWQMNQAPAQTYFARAAEGSHQRSVRRSALDALPVAVPPIEEQRKILELAELTQEEARVYARLAENRREMMAAIATNLLG